MKNLKAKLIEMVVPKVLFAKTATEQQLWDFVMNLLEE